MTDPVLKPWEKRAAKTAPAATGAKPWEKRAAKPADQPAAERKNVGPDGMTPGERAKAAREGTLKPPSEAKLAAVKAVDNVAEFNMDNAPTQFGTFAGNLAPGVTFGFADEIGAGIDAALTDRTYGQSVEMLRARDREMSEAFPKTAVAGQIAGAVAVPVAAAPRGATMMRAGAQNALTGMGLAGLYGFGTGEGGFAERAANALSAAPLGFAVGAASPVIASALSGVAGGAANMLRGVADRGRGTASQKMADRAIARVVERSGQSPDDVVTALRRAASEGQPEYRLMDATGQAGQRAASMVVRRGDDGAEELANFLRQRQMDQSTRVPRMIEDAFDASQSAAKTREGLIAARTDAADAAYTAARGNAAPVDVRGVLGIIDDRTGGMVGSGVRGDGIDAKLLGYRARLAAQPGPDGVSRELSDFDRVLGVKQAIQDDIGAAVRAGRNNEARELGKLVKELDAALEASSDMYRTANDGFRSASRVIDAVDEGADMARPGARSQDTTSRFAAMTDEQKAAARVGYADRVLAGIESNKAIGANRAAPFNSTKGAEEAAAMARNPDVFGRQITRENEMFGTMNRALGGSRTADNLMDEAMSVPTGPGRQAVIDALRLNFGGAATNLAIAVAPALTGQSPATRKLIADALMSADPEVALRAAAQTVKDQGVKRAIERAITSAGAATVAN
jgi:hypothetical protein